MDYNESQKQRIGMHAEFKCRKHQTNQKSARAGRRKGACVSFRRH